MAIVAAYNTKNEEYPPTHRNVYHDHNNCKYGEKILAKDRESGTGGKARCDECKKLG